MARGRWVPLFFTREEPMRSRLPGLFRNDPLACLWCSFSMQTAGQARPAILLRKNLDWSMCPM